MGRTDENNPGVIGQANIQGGPLMGRGKIVAEPGQNRRALSNINGNRIGVPPCAVSKRGLIEKHAICSSKSSAAIPSHRPVTRRFAAQLANKDQKLCTEPTKPNKIAEDCTIIDVDEYNMSNDSSVPMYVKHTEAMMDEIDLMEEVEMEDAMPESVMDIDSDDVKNPLAAVEYVHDIYSYYKDTENSGCVSAAYMSQQYDINERMRAILIDWLIEVHYKFELLDETLFLTVNLIDRFLERHAIGRKRLQLVGVTAMLLACKYEEVSVPVVEDLIVISDRAYTRKEVLDMEKLIVNTLQFNMCVPTPYVFMRRFLKAAQSDKKLELLSFFMIELSLVEFKHWSQTCVWYTTYTEEQLLECSKRMVTFHQKAGTGKLTGVHKKYSTSKFGYAAKAEPAHFLLEVRH
ncbi:hypothetical protein AQUCO_01500385v1 [Aquilegia coerulea]|uniref:Uncharacterized protein n=1 Tax=Aquilegia coerulea TaxID=218851 RepID=A0A2G5DTF1_AQUCA|nr:hypothetical protein AQUCO_01500385v1 [Aquilegia coerulea]